jgi:hypothetical protein
MEDSEARIFVVEDIDIGLVEHLWTVAGRGDDTFLQFLDDFFDDSPPMSFRNPAERFEPLESTTKSRSHVKFQALLLREFEHRCPLTYQEAQTVAAGNYWRVAENYGLMTPCQRKSHRGRDTNFPLILVADAHFAAWFNAKPGSDWKIGKMFGSQISFIVI